MSDQDAKQFIDKLKNDPSVREALANAVRNGASSGASDYGAKLGLNFSGSELVNAYSDEMRAQGLSDDDIKDLTSAGESPHVMYGAAPDGSYATHPAYAASTDESAKYAEPSVASYAQDDS